MIHIVHLLHVEIFSSDRTPNGEDVFPIGQGVIPNGEDVISNEEDVISQQSYKFSQKKVFKLGSQVYDFQQACLLIQAFVA